MSNITTDYSKFKKKTVLLDDWIAKKLELPTMDLIGSGTEGLVFDIGRERAMKISMSRVENQTRLLNKNYKHICKVYQTGRITVPNFCIYRGFDEPLALLGRNDYSLELHKGKYLYYSIMERLYCTYDEEIECIIDIIHNHVSMLHMIDKYNDDVIKKDIRAEYGDDVLAINIYYQIKECIKQAIEIYPNFTDIHNEQFKTNRNGIVKIFDLDEGLFGWDIKKNKTFKNKLV